MWCADRCGALCDAHDEKRHAAAALKDHERMAIREKSAYLQRKMLKKAQQLQDGLQSVLENVNKSLKTITDPSAIVARETAVKSQLWSR
jgi:hypothetical protein